MIKLKSYAKINLYLDIKDKLDNGYHKIETLFQTINLYDEILIQKIEKPVYQIECNNPLVPIGKESIVYQAVTLLMQDNDFGVDIKINKNIPIAAGLGGGSSNVASVMIGICRLFKLPLKASRLRDIALNLGMDIPFFFERGTVYAEGRGEILYPILTAGNPLHIMLINPGINISTKWAYDAFDTEKSDNYKRSRIDFYSYIEKRNVLNLREFSDQIYNCFDFIISKKYPVIDEIKEKLKDLGAVSATISGSGPTVYGIMKNKQQAISAYKKLKNKYRFVYKAKTIRARNIFFK